MKFSRHLQDTQTPEWKKSYIDYDALKVQLGVIRAKALRQVDTRSSFGNTDIDVTIHSAPNSAEEYDDSKEVYLNRGNRASARIASLWFSGTEPTMNGTTNSSGHGPASPTKRSTRNVDRHSFSLALASLPHRVTETASNAQTLLLPRTHRSPVSPFFKDPGFPTPPPLHTVLSNLPATHAKFFHMLDAELGKVETFYAEREKEMHERAELLRKQLDELGIHRQMFHESSAHSKTQSWAKRTYISVPPALSSLTQWFRDPKTKPQDPHQTGGDGILASESERRGRRDFIDTFNLGTQAPEHRRPGGDHSESWREVGVARGATEREPSAASSPTRHDSAGRPSERSDSFPSQSFGGTKHPLDPHEYQYAKRRLRKAVVEHYRGLEALNNYRILNLTGFRKALKKYEKITKIYVLDAYMKEKVEPSAFASGTMASSMLKEMEHLFAMRFEHGDRKKALDHLRVGPSSKTHHFGTFRSGLWLGLALPAIAGGSYLSFQEYTRESLPSWNILLFIYSILVVPLLLVLLIGINILVWARQRISYVFIFKLNPKSRLGHHEYFELPSFLLCTLAYAFWFSLAQIGPSMLWPLIWLALASVVMFNPLRNFMWGHARWWTIKKIAKLGVSGIWVVEFTDAWLGDQFCSLVYSLSRLYFVGCFYTRFFVNHPSSMGQSLINTTTPYQVEPSAPNSALQRLLSSAYDLQAQDAWSTCGAAQNWRWYYLLGALPFMVRFVQNLRRYWDTKLPSQLFNAGKYGMGMMQYFFYCYWRNQNSPHTGKSYILWCFMSTVNAIYGCAWDFLMDWSLCKPHAQYPLLRPELIYTSQIPWYYFSLASNLIIRFIWVSYIFADGVSFELCTFITALLEMLRRVQWNFYRLENKHIHNMGLQRVTREVLLPYNFEAHSNEEKAQLRRRMARLSQ